MTRMVTIPAEEHRLLLDAAEDLRDLRAAHAFDAALAAGEEEAIPAAYVDRLIDGESPVRVFRDLRGLTQAALAERAGLHRVALAKIETGVTEPKVGTAKRLADALGVTVDDLI